MAVQAFSLSRSFTQGIRSLFLRFSRICFRMVKPVCNFTTFWLISGFIFPMGPKRNLILYQSLCVCVCVPLAMHFSEVKNKYHGQFPFPKREKALVAAVCTIIQRLKYLCVCVCVEVLGNSPEEQNTLPTVADLSKEEATLTLSCLGFQWETPPTPHFSGSFFPILKSSLPSCTGREEGDL